MSEVEITQADRDAAASGYYAWCSGNPTIPNRMVEGSADDHSMIQAFARHRFAAEEGKAELVTCLKRLEYWFDTDQEILDAMDHDTRADHERQLAMIRAALARVRGEG